MTSPFPSSIEAYLRDAGFSPTDILVLRRLTEGVPLTLRALAVRTGRSAGVLDQALRKLLQRGIVEKTLYNGHPCYQLSSMQSLVDWLRGETKEHQERIQRRQKDFEHFVGAMTAQKHHPDVQQYDGVEGIATAYGDLFAASGDAEWLTFAGHMPAPDDDPLSEACAVFVGRRQARKIFQRVLAADGACARRYVSRDPFAYRKTLLVPASELSLGLDITIAGDMLLCIDRASCRGCLVRYPGLAASQRAIFELLWARQQARIRQEGGEPAVAIDHQSQSISDIRTSVTRFFGMRRLIGILVVGFCISVLSFVGFTHVRVFSDMLLRHQLRVVSAQASALLTPTLLSHPADDPVLRSRMQLILRGNEAIRDVVLLRADHDGRFTLFARADTLADTHAATPIVEAENLTDTWESSTMSSIVTEAVHGAIIRLLRDGLRDRYIAAAPLVDSQGQTYILGILALLPLSSRISFIAIVPLLLFLCILFAYIAYALLADDRTLLRSLFACMRRRRLLTVLLILFTVECIAMLAMGIAWYRRQLLIHDVGTRLMTIAANATAEINPTDLASLEWARDMKTEEYQRTFRKLNDIRDRNPGVTFAYIVRMTDDDHLLQFVADADSNWNLERYSPTEISQLMEETRALENVWPGYVLYDFYGKKDYRNGVTEAKYLYLPLEQWGPVISGIAPIVQNGNVVAILGVDVRL